MDKITYVSKLIREVPDYPKPGILFKDISPVLSDPKGFRILTDLLAEKAADLSTASKIIAIESRGFILGAALAERLGLGFVMLRKKGKLPWKTLSHTYELEYGEDHLEIHEDAVQPSEKVLIVDDVLATGGTAAAAVKLNQLLQAQVVGGLFFIELGFLKGREKLPGISVRSLIQC